MSEAEVDLMIDKLQKISNNGLSNEQLDGLQKMYNIMMFKRFEFDVRKAFDLVIL
tara:strand:- start:241 stop:405 length:165 start_codon:yes stop_codon:yes gene_type:complete